MCVCCLNCLFWDFIKPPSNPSFLNFIFWGGEEEVRIFLTSKSLNLEIYSKTGRDEGLVCYLLWNWVCISEISYICIPISHSERQGREGNSTSPALGGYSWRFYLCTWPLKNELTFPFGSFTSQPPWQNWKKKSPSNLNGPPSLSIPRTQRQWWRPPPPPNSSLFSHAFVATRKTLK